MKSKTNFRLFFFLQNLGNTGSWIGNNLLADTNLANIPVDKSYLVDEKLNNAPKKNSIQLELSVSIHQFNFKMR